MDTNVPSSQKDFAFFTKSMPHILFKSFSTYSSGLIRIRKEVKPLANNFFDSSLSVCRKISDGSKCKYQKNSVLMYQKDEHFYFIEN